MCEQINGGCLYANGDIDIPTVTSKRSLVCVGVCVSHPFLLDACV